MRYEVTVSRTVVETYRIELDAADEDTAKLAAKLAVEVGGVEDFHEHVESIDVYADPITEPCDTTATAT